VCTISTSERDLRATSGDIGRHRAEQATGQGVQAPVADHEQVGLGLLDQAEQRLDGLADDGALDDVLGAANTRKYHESQHITLVVFGHSEHSSRGRMPHGLSDQGGFNSTCRVL
jgi:hypothetical protein